MVYSKKELKAFTGYERPSKQIDWLRREGVRFFVGADGYPRVLKSDLENKQNQRRTEPDFSQARSSS